MDHCFKRCFYFGSIILFTYFFSQIASETIHHYPHHSPNHVDHVPMASGEHYDHHDYHEHKYPYQPYGFGYEVEDGWGNFQYRHEKSKDPWKVKGSYGYKDAWGIYRHVDYIADKYGFRAHIKTNEPGTAPKDPAAVKMSSHPVPAGHGHPKKHHHHAG